LMAVAWLAPIVWLAPASIARANMRAPRGEPKPPSSAAAAIGMVSGVEVAGETLKFQCEEGSCAVEARYRLRAAAPTTLDLAFVVPSATPVVVHVGGAGAPAMVAAAPPEAFRRKDMDGLADSLDVRRFPVLQARFSANLVVGDNTVVVTYQQPLGQNEEDYGYFHKGRFIEFFRYEVWPLSEWKHARDFRVDGEVTIRRPRPSWWKRTFSNPRSVGCRGSEPFAHAALEQRGDDLRFAFQLTDPLPRRLWCEIGDGDLVPKP
jgi:hypothetical protein